MSLRPALLIGFGNPGRGDDGLGPAFAQSIAKKNLPDLSVEVDYQLTADHALTISRYDLVVFADAAITCDAPYRFSELSESAPSNLGSHTVTPEAAVALSRLLFHATPRAFVIGILGFQFGKIEEGLSASARGNLFVAEAFFAEWYETMRASHSAAGGSQPTIKATSA